MKVKPAARLGALGQYAFAEIDRQVARLKEEGFDPIDFGVGDPTSGTPGFIIQAAEAGLATHRSSGYPSYEGEAYFRRAVASWIEKRLEQTCDPDEEISISLGSKEAIFNVHKAFVDPGDYVISPSPGYPPYVRGSLFAEGNNWLYPLISENDFLPDLDGIPAEVARKARIFWICQPHVPTGRAWDREALCRVADFCAKNEILLCSDEAYIDHYFEEAPESILQHVRENVLAFFSLSKRSCMTGFRCGWVAGDREAIRTFRKLKMNIDSGAPRFIQDAAVAALEDEEHVRRFRQDYLEKRNRMLDALARAGLPRCAPQAGLYIWQKAPDGMTGLDLAKRLLEPDLALITAPGEWLSDPVLQAINYEVCNDGASESAGSDSRSSISGINGKLGIDGDSGNKSRNRTDSGEFNPGADYVRIALVPPMDRVEEAIRRLEGVSL